MRVGGGRGETRADVPAAACVDLAAAVAVDRCTQGLGRGQGRGREKG